MNLDLLKKELLPKFLQDGDVKFYRSLLILALNKLVLLSQDNYKGTLPNLELLDYHDQFIILYRREGDEVYLTVAKVFRRAAHKIYRIMLKKKMCNTDKRFLNLL
jgi:hypothetical protein